MSVATTFSWPYTAARDAVPVSPPEGPESMVPSEAVAAWSAGRTPPLDCITDIAPGSPARPSRAESPAR